MSVKGVMQPFAEKLRVDILKKTVKCCVCEKKVVLLQRFYEKNLRKSKSQDTSMTLFKRRDNGSWSLVFGENSIYY